ncbi:RHS repeat-associated core domain-containing protein [Chloroflexi bacterium TSY]|nr:RHS repeat-associated core domain-containing protein [Chloroflexi bacterium TSY]
MDLLILGNLVGRQDANLGLDETFTYDALNRLETVTVATNDISTTETYRYDARGNIVSKPGVGTYSYDPQHPRAVAQITGALNATYTYDANGNMTSGGGRTIVWSSYNKPIEITKDSSKITFAYGPDRARFRQTGTSGANTKITTYIGTLYEEMRSGSQAEWKHYIRAGNVTVAIYTTRHDNTQETRYLHRDHLGSITTITDESGQAIECSVYEPFGKRKSVKCPGAPDVSNVNFKRGFTGHEHLAAVGLIHMNGRVYDPDIGRFLSADPFVQFPKNLQSLNRYSYAQNNPLSYTDPTGFFLKKLVKKIGRVFRKVTKWVKENWRTVAAITVAAVTGYVTLDALGSKMLESKILAGAAGGFAGGFVASGGDVNAAFIGGLSGAAFAFVGGSTIFGEIGAIGPERVIAHGVVGGITNEAQGGKFATGFITSAFSKSAAGEIQGLSGGDPIKGALISAVVGGTVSRLSGGKFANGALTSAYGYLFNQALSNTNSSIRTNLKFYSRGIKSLFSNIATMVGHAGVYYYAGACAALSGSAECSAVFELAKADAGRMGGAVYDFVNDPELRSQSMNALSELSGNDRAQAYIAGRATGAVALSRIPLANAFAILAIPGGALRASQIYGDGMTLNHAIRGGLLGY